MVLWTFYKLAQRIVTREFIDFRHSIGDDDSLVMVLGCWASVCSARDSRIGDRSRDSPRFRPSSTSTAIGSWYERRSVALDHARVLEKVGSEDRMRREALCQKLLEEGSVLWERRCCTGREYFFHIFSSSKYIESWVELVRMVFQFDWNVTRNENVADIGALQISYKTWHTLTNGKDRSLPGLEGLRPSQLFFISAAQVNIRRLSSTFSDFRPHSTNSYLYEYN